MSAGSYNDLEFNATGLDWINLTAQTAFVIRTDKDISAVAPGSGESRYVAWDGAAGTNPPKLVVTYDSPEADGVWATDGDWVIEGPHSPADNVTHSNKIIIVNGNLTIEPGANLTLHNVTLVINSSYYNEFGINVGGNLTLDNETDIHSNESYLASGTPGNMYLINVTGNFTSIGNVSSHNTINNATMIFGDRNSNITLNHTTVQYGGGTGVYSRGEIYVDHCVFWHHPNNGLQIMGGEISFLNASFFWFNNGTGLWLENIDDPLSTQSLNAQWNRVGIYISESVFNMNNSLLTNNSVYGMKFFDSISNISNGTIESSGVHDYELTYDSQVTVLAASGFNESSIGIGDFDSWLERKHLWDFNIKDLSGNPVSGGEMTITGQDDTVDYSCESQGTCGFVGNVSVREAKFIRTIGFDWERDEGEYPFESIYKEFEKPIITKINYTPHELHVSSGNIERTLLFFSEQTSLSPLTITLLNNGGGIRPDLKFHGIQSTNTTPNLGDSITLSTTIYNEGADSFGCTLYYYAYTADQLSYGSYFNKTRMQWEYAPRTQIGGPYTCGVVGFITSGGYFTHDFVWNPVSTLGDVIGNVKIVPYVVGNANEIDTYDNFLWSGYTLAGTDHSLLTIGVDNDSPVVIINSPMPEQTIAEDPTLVGMTLAVTFYDPDPGQSVCQAEWRFDEEDWNAVNPAVNPFVRTLFLPVEADLWPTNGKHTFFFRAWDCVDDYTIAKSEFYVKVRDTTYVSQDWTIAIYMNGDNNLANFAYYDELEVLDVYEVLEDLTNGSPSNDYGGSDAYGNILILKDQQTFGDSQLRHLDFPYDAGYDKNQTVENIGIPGNLREVNMGDGDTLYAFADWAFGWYPSTYKMLILWDHGAGWQPFMVDNSNGRDKLTMTELDSALDAITDKYGKIDIIGFDACLMAAQEVQYVVKNYANIMIGSEDVEPGPGWYYTGWLEELFGASVAPGPSTVATDIVDAYEDSYTNGTQSAGINKELTTLSAVNLTHTENVTARLDEFAQELAKKANTYNSEIGIAKGNTEDFFITYTTYYYYDLFDFANNIQEEISDSAIDTAAENLKNAINDSIVYERHGDKRTGAHGSTIYFPIQSKFLSDYNSLSMSTNSRWDNFLTKYYASSNDGNTLPSITVTTPSPGAGLSGLVSATGTASDSGGVNKIQYKVDAAPWSTATGTTSWSFNFNATNYAQGNHTLWVRVVDNLGGITYADQSFSSVGDSALTLEMAFSFPNETLTYKNDTANYPMWISNTGNEELAVTLTKSGTNTAWGTLSDSIISISPFTKKIIFLNVTPPNSTAVFPTYANITVTGTNGSTTARLITSTEAMDHNYTFDLVAGWNLISFPLTNSTVIVNASTFAALDPFNISHVVKRNVTNGTYVTYVSGVSPQALNFNISYGDAVFVYVNNTTELTYYGYLPDANLSMNISKGWNLIGYQVLKTLKSNSMLDKIGGFGLENVQSTGSNVYSSYRIGLSPDAYDFDMDPGNGYFIFARNDYLLVFNIVYPWEWDP